MSDPLPLDPFGLWRDMVAQFEKSANALANDTTRSPAFTDAMGKTMSASLVAKKVGDELSTRYLLAMNMPSRADVEALGERLLAIEDRLIAMSAAIERLSGVPIKTTSRAPLASTSAPRRTRKPPPEPPVTSLAKKTRSRR